MGGIGSPRDDVEGFGRTMGAVVLFTWNDLHHAAERRERIQGNIVAIEVDNVILFATASLELFVLSDVCSVPPIFQDI